MMELHDIKDFALATAASNRELDRILTDEELARKTKALRTAIEVVLNLDRASISFEHLGGGRHYVYLLFHPDVDRGGRVLSSGCSSRVGVAAPKGFYQKRSDQLAQPVRRHSPKREHERTKYPPYQSAILFFATRGSSAFCPLF
jgi:hypothetical protein